MPLDGELVRALKESVAESDQPETVNRRLHAWLEALSTRDVSADEEKTFLENALASVNVNIGGGDECE